MNTEWKKMSEEEKEKFYLDFISNPANERIAGYRIERYLDDNGKWVYETISEYEEEEEVRVKDGKFYF